MGREDGEEIHEIKGSMIELVNIKGTKCFEVRVQASTSNVDENKDICSRARAITFYSCQEASRALKGMVD